MKKFTLAVAALLFAPAVLMADICSDLITNYNRDVANEYKELQNALKGATDPDHQAALRAGYDMQVDLLAARLNAALTSEGCNVPVPEAPNPDPVPEPDPVPPTDPVPDPMPEPDPDPTPLPDPDPVPPVDPDPDPTTPPADDDDVNCPPKDACMAQLDAYADQLRAQNVPQNEFVHKMMAKIKELGCVKNYGQWNSHCQKKKKHCDVKKKSSDHKKKQSAQKKSNCKKK